MLPLEQDEKLYGPGLSLTGIEVQQTVRLLHVHHLGGKDNGRTHAARSGERASSPIVSVNSPTMANRTVAIHSCSGLPVRSATRGFSKRDIDIHNPDCIILRELSSLSHTRLASSSRPRNIVLDQAPGNLPARSTKSEGCGNRKY